MAPRTARRTASATASASRRRGFGMDSKASSTGVAGDLGHRCAAGVGVGNADQLDFGIGDRVPFSLSASAIVTMPEKLRRRRAATVLASALISSEPSL